jgi:hypothetical protein
MVANINSIFLTNEVVSPPVVYHKLKDAIQEPESTFQIFVDISGQTLACPVGL